MNSYLYSVIAKYCFSTSETAKNSYDSAQYVCNNNIDGDIIECGLASGGNFGLMLLACKELNIHKKSWGFDSFQGIQLAGKKDTLQAGIGKITHNVDVPEEELLISSGITSHSKNEVIENLKFWNLYDDNIELVEGWIQNSLLPVINYIDKISILRLDMDVYAPTKFALEHLFPKLNKNGVLIIDDWELDGCRIACEEYFDTIKYTPHYMEIPNSTPKYLYK
jgi:O-methyltransferase